MHLTLTEIAILAVNGFAFLTYMVDKILAKSGMRRIPESFLILLGVCFGATGAYLSMLLFRHKTKKLKFSLTMPILMALQWGLCIWQQIFFSSL
jgi:uncharacterized membrane protein YsdA (DUF1294 family)